LSPRDIPFFFGGGGTGIPPGNDGVPAGGTGTACWIVPGGDDAFDAPSGIGGGGGAWVPCVMEASGGAGGAAVGSNTLVPQFGQKVTPGGSSRPQF